MSSDNQQLRLLSPGDLPMVAEIHCAAFPENILSRLGTRVVSAYYCWQLEGPHIVNAFGAQYNGTLEGFCFAGVFNDAMSGFLRRNLPKLAISLLCRPKVLLLPQFYGRLACGARVLRHRLPRRAAGADAAAAASTNPFRVLSIAVRPRSQGLGIGALLLDAAERAAAQFGADEIVLRVDTENLKAIRFYERHGWSVDLESGAWAGRMRKAVNPSIARERLSPTKPAAI